MESDIVLLLVFSWVAADVPVNKAAVTFPIPTYLYYLPTDTLSVYLPATFPVHTAPAARTQNPRIMVGW